MKFAYLIEPPFNYRTNDGHVTGCDVDLARWLFEELRIGRFEPVETEFAELLPGLSDGRWRMTTGLFGTDERRAHAAFSRPIWALPDGLLVRKGNPSALTGYRSVADNDTCILAVIRDQFQHRSAQAFGVGDARIRIFETYTEAATAVLNGEVDAYASVARAHDGFIQRHPAWDVEPIIVPFNEKKPAFGSFAIAKGDHELLEMVNTALDRFIGSTEHRDMMARYGFDDADVDALLID
ncbi:transporter substrate-binding domain-containing protein [Hwanghaeella grinnelliae]|uniref:Transporter substrate-binding domain-containing protein n=1 Tax=Hwanghaeella grinnelliae TaxID=2500179 RepID=A0A437QH83_9PROT|nr:transporter substrate-binding domain-containing protein [Hwanghaeella grinnelliae]RVU33766.1 transporter substrate-binding domain-containing protein [Hwanghaeella grinnelliae]